MTALLEAAHIHKSFGAVTAANDLNVVVQKGERLGLIGNNGAGKTTFINLITGYHRPDTGRILLAGTDITGLAPRLVSRHGVSRSFQIPQLFATFTVNQNLLVALGGASYGWRSFWQPALTPALEADVDSILSRFHLTEYRDQPISTLPGGVRKLVDIAMAVMRRPKLLLLDEPTSGVAAAQKFPLMDLVMEALAGDELTVLFVEHDMEIVARYAGRVLAFYDGRIIADAKSEAVLGDPEVQRLVTGTVN